MSPSAHDGFRPLSEAVLTWISIVGRLGRNVPTARMSVRAIPSRVRAGAQSCRARVAHTQCSPTVFVIFVSTMAEACRTTSHALSANATTTTWPPGERARPAPAAFLWLPGPRRRRRTLNPRPTPRAARCHLSGGARAAREATFGSRILMPWQDHGQGRSLRFRRCTQTLAPES